MRDEEIQNGVFRDAEEWEHYKTMFSSLTSVMSQTGFSEEVSHQTDLKKNYSKERDRTKTRNLYFSLRIYPVFSHY